jgi:hypothetical protein
VREGGREKATHYVGATSEGPVLAGRAVHGEWLEEEGEKEEKDK